MTETAAAEIRTGIGKDIRLEALADAYATMKDRPWRKADKCCEAFVKTIESGYWRPGDFVPTEKEISAVLPVSLGTVQIALRRLAGDGIIKRTRGQGTRIVTSHDPGQEPKHVRFIADDGESLLPLDIRLVSVEETFEQGLWSAYLGTPVSYIRIVRYIDVAGEFTIYNEFFLDGPRFRPFLDFAQETFEKLHLRMILHDRFNCPTLGFTQNIELVTPPPAIADVIGCTLETPAIKHEILSHTLRGAPLSFQQMFIPPNDRKLNISNSV